MMKMIRERLIIVVCAFVSLLVLAAVSPRPAKKAVPARPVEGYVGVLEGVTICVDAGHGGNDGGARARDSLVWERDINLQVAKKVKEALENQGAQVVMTREDANALDGEKRQDLTMRMDLAKDTDMLVSIHMNEYRSRKESGPQVFYRAGQENSRLLAGALQHALIQVLQPEKQRQSLAGDYYILSSDLPSVLVECGFLSNAAEEKMLLDKAYQQKIASAIALGIADYWTLSGEKTPSE